MSVNIDKPNKGGSSGPGGHYALCGNHGQHRNSMVMLTTIIKTDNETIKLKQNLTCRNYGIYAAESTTYNAKYNLLDKLKPNSQPGSELTEPIGTKKTRNLTMTKAHF